MIYNFLIRTFCLVTSPRVKIFMNDSLAKSLEPPSGGELKLLTHLNAENWAHNWVFI